MGPFRISQKVLSKYFLIVVFAFFSVSAVAAPVPTTNQLKALEQLTPQQRQLIEQLTPQQQMQLLEQLKGESSTAPWQDAQTLEEPQVVKPREVETSKKIEEMTEKATDAPTLEEEEVVQEIKQDLKQFGYDLFAGTPTTFAPATDIPIPLDYIIGPGDNIQIQLYGKENVEYDLVVTREGLLRFPGVGPISVAGMSFGELKDRFHDRLKRQMIGVKGNITLGKLRSIRIFILGDAIRPGSYTISALSNMTNALFVSGGVQSIGSLRNIQLKRSGKVVTTLDLYDLLLKGDTSGDQRLQPGDVIFIPPIGKTVGVAGEVKRPAIYELKPEQTIAEALQFAGGLLPTAFPKETELERITESGEHTIIDIDATTEADLNKPVKDGDVIRVYSVLEKMENIVLLTGHVQRPGGEQWKPGLRLTDVIPSVNSLLPNPDLEYILIRREIQPDRHIEIVTTRLSQAFRDPASEANTLLQSRDQIFVFGLGVDRNELIDPVIMQLENQARFNQPPRIVNIEGNVHYPGKYPMANDMRVSDLIRASFDILPRTDLDYALITREVDTSGRIEVFSFSLKDYILKTSNPEADPQLQPKDTVFIFSVGPGRQALITPVIEQLRAQTRQGEFAPIVTIRGLVENPGDYPLDKNMRVADLIIAAGKLQEAAYTTTAEVSRFNIVNGQYREVSHYTITKTDIYDGYAVTDFVFQAYDSLLIKRMPQWAETETIELIGEFRFPGIYPFRRGETVREVITRAGGLTPRAFPGGAIFTRKELQEKEQEQINSMAARLEADLAAMNLEQKQKMDPQAQVKELQAVAMANSLLKQLQETQAVGRLVIDLDKMMQEPVFEEDADFTVPPVILKDGDKLYVPQKTQEVTIIGEVQQSTSHLYMPDLDRDAYINMSGGLTYKADDDRIYTVRANGAVVTENSSNWFGSSSEVRPGDTIVVPLEADRMSSLTLWTNVTQIIYQLGIAAAAWNSIGVFD